MRVLSATKTTVTVGLNRKEVVALRDLASNEVEYLCDAIYHASAREKRKYQTLRDLWQKRYEQLDLAVLAIAKNQSK